MSLGLIPLVLLIVALVLAIYDAIKAQLFTAYAVILVIIVLLFRMRL